MACATAARQASTPRLGNKHRWVSSGTVEMSLLGKDGKAIEQRLNFMDGDVLGMHDGEDSFFHPQLLFFSSFHNQIFPGKNKKRGAGVTYPGL